MSTLTRLIGRSRFFARKLRHPIPADGLVLDVGSGCDPHPTANVIVDRVVEGAGERTFRFKRQGLVVLGDVAALPFKDLAFAYVICSHVLEHVDDPAMAAAELCRVAPAGYVETPSDVHEYMFPIGWHRWAVSEDDDHLMFRSKESPYLNDELGGYFRAKWAKDSAFMSFVWSHTDELFIQHHWTGRLKVAVQGRPTWCLESTLAALGDAPRDSPSKRFAYSVLARVAYRRKCWPRRGLFANGPGGAVRFRYAWVQFSDRWLILRDLRKRNRASGPPASIVPVERLVDLPSRRSKRLR